MLVFHYLKNFVLPGKPRKRGEESGAFGRLFSDIFCIRDLDKLITRKQVDLEQGISPVNFIASRPFG